MHKLNGEAAVVANRMTSVVAQAARVKSNGEATGRTRAASVLQCALLATLLAGAAAARADCVDTVGLNAAEQQFLDRAQAALKAQLCPAAAGSGIRWNDGGGAGGVVTTCRGSARKVVIFAHRQPQIHLAGPAEEPGRCRRRTGADRQRAFAAGR